jgi:hypothetical protein
MTLQQFWVMIFGKQIVWDERARGRDKLAQRWVQRLRFSDTHLGLANLAQLLINALTVQVKSVQNHLSGLPTNQDFTSAASPATGNGLFDLPCSLPPCTLSGNREPPLF